MKTYYDLLLSRDMSKAFSSLAFGNLLVFCILYVFDSEYKLIRYFAELTNFDFFRTYWLVSLLLGLFSIVGNVVVFVRYSNVYTLVESDLAKSIKYLNRERKTSDLISGNVVYQSYPRSLIIFFIALALFSVYWAFNNIIVTPIFELNSDSFSPHQVTKLDMSYFYSLGLMSFIPAYIIVVIRMLIKSFISHLRN